MISITMGTANRNSETTISGSRPRAVVNAPVLGWRIRRTIRCSLSSIDR